MMKPFNIRDLKLDKKQISIFAVIFIALGYMFIYLPLASKISLKKKEWQAIEKDLVVARGLIFKKDSLGRKGHLLSRPEVSLAIDEITKIGRKQNINFVSISPREIEPVAGASHRRLPVELDLEAEYRDLGSFLAALKDLRESFVTVRSLKISRHESVYSLLRSKITIDIYVRGDDGG